MVTGMRRSESIIEPELFHYHDHFEFLSLIGETKTSEVFRVKHRQSGEIFAVKRSRKRFRSKLQRERCLREIEAVAALPSHENIVAQYRAWQEVCDNCSNGSYCS
jgi:serine/threonine protein kinase